MAMLGGCCFQHGGLDQLGLFQAFARGTVEEDGVAIGFPDGGELDAAGAVQAEEDAAGPLSANQNPFRDLKSTDLQFVLLANFVMDVSAKLIQVVKLER
jgi:hypothetical protein